MMKRQLVLTIMVIITIVTACNKKENVDLVKGISPVNRWSQDRNEILDSLQSIPQAEQGRFLQANWPTLTSQLTAFLKANKIVKPKQKIDSIGYFYGSVEKVKALDLAGVKHTGYFKNQLVAFVYIHGSKHPFPVLVYCTNGIFGLIGDALKKLHPVMTDTNFEFTIEKGKGIAYYVGSDETAIQIAEMFDLRLFKGKGTNGNTISATQARKINTAKKQVTVLVYEGDYFNLSTMEYRPSRK